MRSLALRASLAVVAAAVLWPAAAQAALVSLDGSTVYINDGNNAADLLDASFGSGAGGMTLTVTARTGSASLTSDNAGCTGSGSTVTCSIPNTSLPIVANLYGGDDVLTLAGAGLRCSNCAGGAGKDQLHGAAGDDLLDGGDDSDHLDGGGGADAFMGGAGTSDTVSYSSSTASVTAGLPTGGATSSSNNGAPGENDVIRYDVEQLYGSEHDDTLTGNEHFNILNGAGGSDTVSGGGDADWLRGGVGDDFLIGGAGNDELLGEGGNDYLIGDGDGSVGQDELVGGDGTDMAKWVDRTVPVTIALAEPGSSTSSNGATGENDMLSGDIEGAAGGSGGDTIGGSSPVNTLYGNGGDDVLTSRDSLADTVYCGDGSDRLTADAHDTADACESIDRGTTSTEPTPTPTPTATTTATPPPTTEPHVAPPDTTIPQLSKLDVSPGVLKKGKGGRFVYALSEAATVTFTVFQKRPGRSVGGRCVKRSHRNRKRKKCDRLVRVKAELTDKGDAGKNSFAFKGKVGKRTLPEARYRLVAVAEDAAGNRSERDLADFRVKE